MFGSLIDDFMVDCQMVDRVRIPDGEGGFITQWVDGVQFEAAISFNNSIEARVAEKQGVTSLYTVTCHMNCILNYHDVFRRLSDGKLFRVTSDGDDIVSPAHASFKLRNATAEEWELPR